MTTNPEISIAAQSLAAARQGADGAREKHAEFVAERDSVA